MSSQFVPLFREFFERDTITVSREILGKSLVRIMDRRTLVARIVEVEAYIGEHDPAAHAFFGRTKRTDVLYGEPGHAYIFQIHGHNCLNFVAEPSNSPGCVLVRAAQPLIGIEQMKRFRDRKTIKDTEVANGPGKLCKALDIGMSLYGTDLVSSQSPLQVCEDITNEKFEIQVSKRIGIAKAIEWELRFTVEDNIFVSKQ